MINTPIAPGMFSGLLDTLAGQFYKKKSASCSGNGFVGQLGKEAEEFFSVDIICEDLGEKDIFAVLCDDSQAQGGKRSFTFVIFIDCKKIKEHALKVLFSLMLAHEICHFTFYYELFMNLGGNASLKVYDKFRHTISGTFEEGITPKKTAAYRVDEHAVNEHVMDEHSIIELIYKFGKYPDEHFANKNKTSINYQAFFFHFLEHLKFDKLLNSYKFHLLNIASSQKNSPVA